MKVKITDVDDSERMRKDLGDIEDFANSLARYGQLQPIVIDKNYKLLAGGRRLAAAKHLQWDEIEAVYREDVDEVLGLEIELEENLRRKDLSWVEEVLGIERLVDVRQQKYGAKKGGPKTGIPDLDGYSTYDAAHDLDRSQSGVSQDLILARGLREFPELANEKTKSSAFSKYQILRTTALRAEQARRTRPESEAEKVSFDEWNQSRKGDAPRQVVYKTGFKGHGTIYHANCLDVLKFFVEKGIRADCIVTDPPYGLGMHKEGQSIAGSRLAENVGTMYDDDPHTIMDMLDQAFMYASKILTDKGHAYVFFHHTMYERVFLMLRKHFGSCEETPIVWIKNTPGIGDPNRAWVYGYEPCFWINRGRILVKAQAFNYLKYDTIPAGSKIHPTEKPTALLRHLIGASCVSGETVLDPFAGSGSTLVAANQLGCKFVGIEKHEPFYRAAIERLSEEIAAHTDSSSAEQANP